MALVAAWGAKSLGDAAGETEEVGAIMGLSLRAADAASELSRFTPSFTGNGHASSRDP